MVFQNGADDLARNARLNRSIVMDKLQNDGIDGNMITTPTFAFIGDIVCLQ